jgi:cob(I)alamin adenosyltransferase
MKKDYSITTKKGDKGETGLLDNTRVDKYDLRPEAYGSLDEASAFLGLVRAHTDNEEIKELMWTIQNHIYLINSELACPPESLFLLKTKINKDHLKTIEIKSSEIEQKLNLPKKFVIYGQTQISSYLDIARAVARRAERRVTELDNIESLDNKIIAAYLNRLSDTLYLLARYDEFSHNIPYAHPTIK